MGKEACPTGNRPPTFRHRTQNKNIVIIKNLFGFEMLTV
jgi:hypothetical protein